MEKLTRREQFIIKYSEKCQERWKGVDCGAQKKICYVGCVSEEGVRKWDFTGLASTHVKHSYIQKNCFVYTKYKELSKTHQKKCIKIAVLKEMSHCI